MSSLGDTLQRARVEQGLDVTELALRLKINPKYFAAIEADDRASFPSAFFYRSFVHQYALALSLNLQQIDAQLDQILSNEAPPPLPGQDGYPIRKREPEVQISNSRKGLRWALALVALLLAGSGIYLWYMRTTGKNPVFAAVSRVVDVARKVPLAVRFSETAPRVVSAALPAQPAQPQETPVMGDRLVLNLIAKEQTWLSVYSDGKRVYAGVLQANETKAIEGREFARMTIGNAGALEVQFNGKPIGALGARGQVRTVLFTRDNFQIVQPKDGV